MQITTELDAGERGFFLVDNKVVFEIVHSVRVQQMTQFENGRGGVRDTAVDYEVKIDGSKQFVPEKRAGKTKEELLKKL